VNDIIIFNRTLENHLKHFNRILRILKRSGITISIVKYYFAASLIQTLKYYISRLNLNIVQEKIEIIRNFKFSLFLNQLENTIEFIEYYRKFVEYYAILSKPFMELKTKDFKNTFIKNDEREKYAFYIFLSLLIIPEELLLYKIAFENLK
jgi:hypothetical protein